MLISKPAGSGGGALSQHLTKTTFTRVNLSYIIIYRYVSNQTQIYAVPNYIHTHDVLNKVKSKGTQSKIKGNEKGIIITLLQEKDRVKRQASTF